MMESHNEIEKEGGLGSIDVSLFVEGVKWDK